IDAFDTGMRTFDQPYLLYASEGAFHLETPARTCLLLPHRAALIRQAYPIRIWTTGPATSSSVLFDNALDGQLGEPCQVIPVNALMVQMIAHAQRWSATDAASDPASAVFFQALGNVAIDAAQSPDPMWFPNAESPDLRRAIEWTMKRLGERLCFADVAAAAHVSERTLARRFASELGLSWQQFLKRVRLMEAARQLTLTDKTVAEIAYEAGLASASAFSSQFNAVMGEPPTRYRQRLKKGGGFKSGA
ncbi:MAG TPA: AraC family transcriptional regulator, partial [Dyella sp.]|uniref:AraC family transcriptional regulator n=1 Tax=Dyella sp. TaxID=1869338 RepID=UPI002C31BD92